MWQIAQRDYKFGRGKHKSLTKATYDAVGDHFRDLWGEQAGWAHSVLFTADLRAFSETAHTNVEFKEEIVTKVEGKDDMEVSTATAMLTRKTVSRRSRGDHGQNLEADELIAKRKVKRRRKS